LPAGSVARALTAADTLDILGTFLQSTYTFWDRLRGLVVWVPGYKSRGPGSIPGATTFLGK
jgi:hypothetical protein